MQAGRELDALVHAKIMGKDPTQKWSPPFPGKYEVTGRIQYADGRTEEVKGKIVDASERFLVSEPIPPYSTSIQAAWLVVEKLIRDGHSFDLSADKNGIDAIFDAKSLVNVSGFSAAHAICLAALRAVGVDSTP